MFRSLIQRIKFGNRTIGYPETAPSMPERFSGFPRISSKECPDGCLECLQVCPTDAINLSNNHPIINLGQCLFCDACEKACPSEQIEFTSEFGLAANKRSALLARHDTEKEMIFKLNNEMLRLFKRSLKLRQVSAGGCNGCEVEVNVLGTIVYDLGRFGIQMVASPRHADGLLITGPVTENMRLALKKTYDAVPDPKIVIAMGACAISGGPYINHPQVHNGADSIVPVDLYIPGCPPHPITILDGLLRLLDKVPEKKTDNSA